MIFSYKCHYFFKKFQFQQFLFEVKMPKKIIIFAQCSFSTIALLKLCQKDHVLIKKKR